MQTVSPVQKLGRLRIRHMRILIAIYRNRSIRSVASHLCISPTAVSKTLAEIETLAGRKLFERTSNGMVPTDLLREIVGEIETTVSQYERLTELFESRIAGTTGDLTIAIKTISARHFLQNALPAFCEAFPNVGITMREGPISDLVEDLSQGRLDFLVTYDQPILNSAQFARLKIADGQKLVIIAGKNHRLVGDKITSFERLLDNKWCIPDRTARFHHHVERLFFKHGHALPKTAVHCSDFIIISQLVKSANYLAAAPQRSILDDRMAPAIAALDFDTGETVEPVSVTWSQNLIMRPSASQFLAYLRLWKATRPAPD